ncbi:MAG: quinone oxidoreductase family protein [Allosphingosinicella sp.]|uniref:quinone oxidoreductase family protein n=1 Tax=Allosphingosinicella sp. TaxID=2823234 RepID=UPI00395E0A98
MKARAARIARTGGPEAIEWSDVELGAPGPGEVLVRHSAIGLNYIDVYHRSGVYPVELPSGLGLEAAGVVEAAGEGTGFAPGDRVATFGPERGAYATARLVRASSLFRLPDDISDDAAAAGLLKGCTAEFLVERCARVEPGWPVLVHAAAGGVGLILVQWLKAIGAEVIGTAGGAAKAETAKAAGAAHVIDYAREDVAARVRELTGGSGVRVVFDGVGRATFMASVDATARRGLVVSYGNASGKVGEVDFGILAAKGSLFTTRPTLFDYYADPDERRAGAARLFEVMRSGAVKVEIGQRYPLEQAARAHRDLEARATTGSTLLMP